MKRNENRIPSDTLPLQTDTDNRQDTRRVVTKLATTSGMTRTIVKNPPCGRRKASRTQSTRGSLTGANALTPEPSYSSAAPSSDECAPMQDVAFATETKPVATGECTEMDDLSRFDFDVRFGPYLGLSRLERWVRAQRLGLEPPSQVRDILLGIEIGVLTRFDLDVRFGPFLGVGRLERWERAERLGLEPPREIWDILRRSLSARNMDNCGSSGKTTLW